MENNWLKIEQEGDKVILRECSQEATGKIVIPEGVICIDPFAFDRCIGLTSIEIPNSVISIGDGAFDDCTNLKSITIAPNNRIYDSRNNCNAIIETATNTLIRGCEETVIPDDITIIEQGAFSGCVGLSSITLPSCLKSIKACAFGGCVGLKYVEIPSGVTFVDYDAFCACKNLNVVRLPESIHLEHGHFGDCPGLIDYY